MPMLVGRNPGTPLSPRYRKVMLTNLDQLWLLFQSRRSYQNHHIPMSSRGISPESVLPYSDLTSDLDFFGWRWLSLNSLHRYSAENRRTKEEIDICKCSNCRNRTIMHSSLGKSYFKDFIRSYLWRHLMNRINFSEFIILYLGFVRKLKSYKVSHVVVWHSWKKFWLFPIHFRP